MYGLVLGIHSWLRWAALLTGVVAALQAWRQSADGSGGGNKDTMGLLFMVVMDLQLLLGLLLYGVLSPFTSAAFKDFGTAMRTPQLRYWAVEHITLMIAAVAVVHLGRVLARKKSNPAKAARQRAIFFTLAVISMLLTIPWPGTTNGRPLFRGL